MIRGLALMALLAAAGNGVAQSPMPDCRAVPGWVQKDETRTFVPDNLFDYMDGNAEGYLVYEFRRMTGVTCQSGGASILIDVSEMADPELAYGIFCANRHPRFPVEKIGMAGQVMPRRATFAKGKYYVELAANPEGDHTKALRAFVADMEKRVPGRTELPEAIGWFPTEKLAAGSVRLVPQSVLGIRILKRGYIGQYEFGKAFIVPESTPEAAVELMKKLRARIGKTEPAKIADEGFLATDRYLGRMCVARKGRFVCGFAGLSEGQDGTSPTAALAARIP
jgi:hypothetical protein